MLGLNFAVCACLFLHPDISPRGNLFLAHVRNVSKADVVSVSTSFSDVSLQFPNSVVFTQTASSQRQLQLRCYKVQRGNHFCYLCKHFIFTVDGKARRTFSIRASGTGWSGFFSHRSYQLLPIRNHFVKSLEFETLCHFESGF